MKVYTLLYSFPYEGETLCGIVATEEEAKAWEEARKLRWFGSCYYEEVELGEVLHYIKTDEEEEQARKEIEEREKQREREEAELAERKRKALERGTLCFPVSTYISISKWGKQ